jgi:hypothetical protein
MSITGSPSSSASSYKNKVSFVFAENLFAAHPELFHHVFRGTNPLGDAVRFGGPTHHAAASVTAMQKGLLTLKGAGNCELKFVHFVYLDDGADVSMTWVAPTHPGVRIATDSAAHLVRMSGVRVVKCRTLSRIVLAFASTTDGAVRIGVASTVSDTYNRRNFRYAALQKARGHKAIVTTPEEAIKLRVSIRDLSARRLAEGPASK